MNIITGIFLEVLGIPILKDLATVRPTWTTRATAEDAVESVMAASAALRRRDLLPVR